MVAITLTCEICSVNTLSRFESSMTNAPGLPSRTLAHPRRSAFLLALVLLN